MYLGANAGYAFNNTTSYTIVGNTALNANAIADGVRPGFLQPRGDGFTGGGQIDYNYQVGHGLLSPLNPGADFVAGVEADAAYTDLRESGLYVGRSGEYVTNRSRLDFLGTVRGRLGIAFGNLLVFGTGGFAYGGVNDTLNYYTIQNVNNYSGVSNPIRTGYAVGGGVEFAVPTSSFLNVFQSSAVTIRAEYLHYDLGASTLFLPNLFGSVNSYTVRIRNEGDLVRAGVNYKFDLGGTPAPVIARY